MCSTFIFKVKHWGQTIDSGFSLILNIRNVIIDTQFTTIACKQPELTNVIQQMRVISSSKVTRSKVSRSKVTRCNQVSYSSNSFSILDLENVRIDNKINIVSHNYVQQEKRKVIQKCFTLIFKVMHSRLYHRWIQQHRCLTRTKYFIKLRLWRHATIQGMGWNSQPLRGGVFGWINNLGIWG